MSVLFLEVNYVSCCYIVNSPICPVSDQRTNKCDEGCWESREKNDLKQLYESKEKIAENTIQFNLNIMHISPSKDTAIIYIFNNNYNFLRN